MKKFLLGILLFALPALGVDKDFKGTPPPQSFSFGVMAGMGILDGHGGFALPVTFGAKLLDRGFAPDINNQVFLELQAGPLFISGFTAFQWSLLVRWDFIKDGDWTFYAAGGPAGTSTSYTTEIYPRFAGGAIWSVFEAVSLRAEVSHELIALGIVVPF